MTSPSGLRSFGIEPVVLGRLIAVIFPKDLRIDHAFQIFAFDGVIEAIALRVSTIQRAHFPSS